MASGMTSAILHASLIESTPGLRLSPSVSSQPEKVGKDFPIIPVVPTREHLLAQPEITLIVIATPNEMHDDLAKQVLVADNHVIVERPFVLYASSAEERMELAQRQPVVLSIFHTCRWNNDVLTIRHLLLQGLQGDLFPYDAQYDRSRPRVRDRWRERAELGAGILYDLGLHLIAQALCLCGFPQAVWADVQAQRANAQADDSFHLVFSYPKRCVILHAGLLVRASGPRVQLLGSAGSFITSGFDSQAEALIVGKRPGDPGWGEDPVEQYGTIAMDVGKSTMEGTVKMLPGCYEVFYQGVIEVILSGKSALVTAQEATNTLKVIEAAWQSQQGGGLSGCLPLFDGVTV
jgi:scyllo-inositol 2-dehydrogenase (NADP+)